VAKAFSERVTTLEPSCRLTGVTNPTLLVTSHIKPWRACTTAGERLDGHNGLLLTPSVDRLFDRGLITFREDGSLVVSPRLSADDRHRLRLAECEAPRAFTPGQLAYLRHHGGVTLPA
jgi:putative restriction endonuclease